MARHTITADPPTAPAADPITVSLPDGSTRELPAGSTALDLATSIARGLAKKAVAATVGGAEVDLPVAADTPALERRLADTAGALGVEVSLRPGDSDLL